MTEEAIARIKAVKNNSTFDREFIDKVDREWGEILQIFSKCKHDLSKVEIVQR